MEVAHKKQYVYDTSVLVRLTSLSPEESGFVCSRVLDEIIDESALFRVEGWVGRGVLSVEDAGKRAIGEVDAASRRTGDATSLSETDRHVAALAFERSGIVVTDDYALQNVCRELGIPWEGFRQRGTKERWLWRQVCTGCRKVFEQDTGLMCPVCGSPVKKKRIQTQKK